MRLFMSPFKCRKECSLKMDLIENERDKFEKELSLELTNLELLIQECKKFMQPVETAIDAIRATLSKQNS